MTTAAAPGYFCPRCGAQRGAAGTCERDRTPLVEITAGSLLGAEVGHYVLVQLLGEGGMGSVYRAVHPSIGAEVAIKVLHAAPAPGTDITQRFLLEARAVNRVRHPSLIRILDTGVLADRRPYLVMELLDGVSLADVVGEVPFALASYVTCELLEALDAVHDSGVVHRDLKPANVFLARDGRVVVLDFGIAKLVASDGAPITRTTGLIGTPEYMAPEQIRSLPLDRRTDVYAVGVLLYELITGHRPFAAAATFDMLVQHLERRPASPRDRVPELPVALADAILRALEKDPASRFQTAAAMASALRSATPSPATRGDAVALVAARAASAPPPALEPATARDPSAQLGATTPLRAVRATGPTVPDPAASATTVASRPPERVGPERPVLTRRRWPVALAATAVVGGLAVAAARIMTGAADPIAARADAGAIATPPVPAAPDAARARLANAAITTGVLEVRSDPSGAALVVDHVARGTTPLALTLAPGAHELRVELSGYRAIDEAAEVTANERASVLLTLPAEIRVQRRPVAAPALGAGSAGGSATPPVQATPGLPLDVDPALPDVAPGGGHPRKANPYLGKP